VFELLTELFSALRDADPEYSVHRAVLPGDRDKAYRVRYRVYCEEKRFEPHNPSGVECDAYDVAGSAQSLLLSTRLGFVCGSVRLVFPNTESEHELPIDAFAQNPQMVRNLRRVRESCSCAELSRLCVLPNFRGVWGKQDLLLGAFAEAWRMDVGAILAVADPRFARYLTKQEIDFVQIGDPVEKNGKRLPILIGTEANFDRWLDLMSQAEGRTDFSSLVPSRERPSTQRFEVGRYSVQPSL
jgi:N-acyl-L-homoserine lactone synthetase